MIVRSPFKQAIRSPLRNSLSQLGLGGIALPLRGLAANNFAPQNLQAVNVASATMTEIYLRVQMVIGADSTDLVVLFPNWGVQAAVGIKNPGNSMQVVEAAFEINSTFQPILFSGLSGATFTNGSNNLADTLQASAFSLAKFAKGTTCWTRLRLRYSTPASDQIPHMGGGKGLTAGYKVDPTKVNVTTGIQATGVLAYSMINGGVNGTDAVTMFSIYMPILLGHHNKPCPVMVGDSKTYGTGDAASVNTGAAGMTRLSFTDPTLASSAICPSINMGVPSGNASDWATSVSGADITLPRALFAYCTHAIVGYGTNAFQTTQLQTVYGYIRTAGITQIIQRSLTPNVVGTKLTFTSMSSVGTACAGVLPSTAALVNGNTYTIVGVAPSAYNGSYVVTVLGDGVTINYTSASAPGGNSTVQGTIEDQYRTIAGQALASGWGVGGSAQTYETTLSGWTATDANLTFFQSQGERAATSGADYWHWFVNGTANYETNDGKHEARYEDNIGVAGTATTQAGGTVSTSLRTLYAAFT